jgi:DNA-binding transcriptional LysR family regulator
MSTVPTELLRTLVAVVDLRSFTKAAQSLGVTQPAVSAQIKRLQSLLGADLLDKSAPGVTLTSKGEMVVAEARRLLAVNDRILNLAVPRAETPPLRIGLPGDFAGAALPPVFAKFHARNPTIRFRVRGDSSENVLRGLRHGHIDLAIALSFAQPPDARHYWREETAWVRSHIHDVPSKDPLKLVLLGEESVVHKLAIETLHRARCPYDIVYTASSQRAVLAAVAAGLGVALLSARTVPLEFRERDGEFLPKAADMWCGIYLREGVDTDVLEELADATAEALRPLPDVQRSVAAEPFPEPALAMRAVGRS